MKLDDIKRFSPAAQAQIAKKLIEAERGRQNRKTPAPKEPDKPKQEPDRTLKTGDGTISFILYGDPRTKKNNLRIAGSGEKCPVCRKPERQWVAQSNQYMKYEKECEEQLFQVFAGGITNGIATPVNCKYLFYMGTKRKVDGLNLSAAIDDILVKFGLLKDDNSEIVIGHDGTRVFYDKDNPRVEIEIRKMESGNKEG